MTVKRRVIWMRDEEWASLTSYAKEQGETVSGVIREFWRQAAGVPDVFTEPSLYPHIPDPRAPRTDKEAQAARDAILRRMNK